MCENPARGVATHVLSAAERRAALARVAADLRRNGLTRDRVAWWLCVSPSTVTNLTRRAPKRSEAIWPRVVTKIWPDGTAGVMYYG